MIFKNDESRFMASAFHKKVHTLAISHVRHGKGEKVSSFVKELSEKQSHKKQSLCTGRGPQGWSPQGSNPASALVNVPEYG